MKINHKDALSIFNLPASSTFADIKLAYRKASSEFHPDRNPAGLEMMKIINTAYQALSDYTPQPDNEISADNIGEELNTALNAIITLGLTIEVCGSWLWVSGDTRPHREILKQSGYRWAPKKLMWSFCGGKRTTSRGKFSMDQIRDKHGSMSVKSKESKRIAA